MAWTVGHIILKRKYQATQGFAAMVNLVTIVAEYFDCFIKKNALKYSLNV